MSRAAYERDGYVIARGLLPPALVAELAAHVTRDIEPGIGRDGRIQAIYDAHGLTVAKVNQLTDSDPAFGALAHHPTLVDVVESLVGAGARKFRDVLIVKPPHTDGFFSYHQDSAYWDVEPKALVSCWIALGDVSVEASCLRVIPGSHRRLLPHGLFFGERPLPRFIAATLRRLVSVAGTGDAPRATGGSLALWRLKRMVTEASRRLPFVTALLDYRVDPRQIQRGQEVALPVAAGDVIFFHSLLVHGSGGNRTARTRHASIISYMSKDSVAKGRFVDARRAP